MDKLARVSSGYSPADIANLVHEAAILTVRNKKDYVGWQEITEAMERIELGLRLRFQVRPIEREATAYHESGHAIITYLCQPKIDTFKLSIVQRERTLGVSWSHEKDETRKFTKQDALTQIMCGLGGYVAERIRFGYNASGVESDFNNIMSIAHNMVYKWGMGESGFLGNFSVLFLTRQSTEPMLSEEMKARLDADVQKILKTCVREVEQILTRERPLLDKLAAELLKKQELDYDQMEEIFKSFGKSRSSTDIY
jgi:cell division protease FtsH